jgi:type IV secretory pathway VirJ component
MRTAGSVCGQPFCLSAPKGYRRYHASLAVSATSVATPAVKPATTVETAATVKATAAMETAATVESLTVEALTAESTAVETPAMKAAIKATATVEAAMKATIETPVKAAIKETITVAEAKAPPGSGADEDAAIEPFRAVIIVGSAGIRIVVVIAIGARRWAVVDRRWTVIDRPTKSNAEPDVLRVRVRSREETNTEKKTE